MSDWESYARLYTQTKEKYHHQFYRRFSSIQRALKVTRTRKNALYTYRYKLLLLFFFFRISVQNVINTSSENSWLPPYGRFAINVNWKKRQIEGYLIHLSSLWLLTRFYCVFFAFSTFACLPLSGRYFHTGIAKYTLCECEKKIYIFSRKYLLVFI